jgi:uncharacterized protein YggT (Ycf19 family)
MGLIHSILDLAALLLWLGWRDVTSGALLQNSATPLARTLRQAGTTVVARRKYLGGLAVLLLLRALIYWWIGAAVNWTPQLDLVAITIPFRSEFFGRMLLFSGCSFGATLAAFYLSLLLLSLVNRRVPDPEPLQKFVRSHLGWFERLPGLVKLLLPVGAALLLRLGLSPLLNWWDLLPTAMTVGAAVKQGLLIGVGACLIWKHVVAGLLLLYFLNSYVYFGNHPLWNYVNHTSRRLLAPLRWVPLRFGRMDFAPVVGIVVVYLLGALAEHWLPRLYPA